MTQCFVCRNCKKTTFIRYAGGKVTHMLRIHTCLRKLSTTNVYDLHLNKMNPFDIGVRCINIARSELLFKIYIMALNRDKYDIEV